MPEDLLLKTAYLGSKKASKLSVRAALTFWIGASIVVWLLIIAPFVIR